MAVLRLFAAAREAAGRTTDEIPATTVGDVLDEACRRYGDRFTAVLGTCRVWVNGQPADGATPVLAADVVAVLPPVSGGARRPPPPAPAGRRPVVRGNLALVPEPEPDPEVAPEPEPEAPQGEPEASKAEPEPKEPAPEAAEVLTDGDASRLRRRLVQGDRIVTALSGYLGFMGDPFDVRDPTALIVQAHHPAAVPVDRVLATMDEEVRRLADGGLEPGELRRVTARLAAHALHDVDSILGRSLAMAVFEQQRGRAELVAEMPGLLAAVDEADLVAAAATLAPERRAVLELVSGSGS